MKNIFLRFSFVCFLLSGIHGFAQEVQLATLQSGDNMQVFYGANALIDALSAAKTGDLISLSSGIFTAPTITKVVTIQGAGCATDFEKGRYATMINGTTTISLQETDEGLLIEGIYFGILNNTGKLVSCTFTKCCFNTVTLNSGSSTTSNCSFFHCRIGTFNPDQSTKNLFVKNSIINSIGSWITTEATLIIQNSFLGIPSGNNGVNAVFTNNILSISGIIPSSSTAYNNVCIRGGLDLVTMKSGNTKSDIQTLFGKEELAVWSIEDYVLTSEAQTTFLGTDGTQVGIYGGSIPFSDVPSNLQITKKEIDAKSSPDGKLKVNITVE